MGVIVSQISLSHDLIVGELLHSKMEIAKSIHVLEQGIEDNIGKSKTSLEFVENEFEKKIDAMELCKSPSVNFLFTLPPIKARPVDVYFTEKLIHAQGSRTFCGICIQCKEK